MLLRGQSATALRKQSIQFERCRMNILPRVHAGFRNLVMGYLGKGSTYVDAVW